MREILGSNVVSNPDPTRCVVETSGFKLINFTVKSVASIAQLVERYIYIYIKQVGFH